MLLPPKNYGVKPKVKKKYYYVEFENGKRRRFESNIDRYNFISSFLSLNPDYTTGILINTSVDVISLIKKWVYTDDEFLIEDCEDF